MTGRIDESPRGKAPFEIINQSAGRLIRPSIQISRSSLRATATIIEAIVHIRREREKITGWLVFVEHHEIFKNSLFLSPFSPSFSFLLSPFLFPSFPPFRSLSLSLFLAYFLPFSHWVCKLVGRTRKTWRMTPFVVSGSARKIRPSGEKLSRICDRENGARERAFFFLLIPGCRMA